MEWIAERAFGLKAEKDLPVRCLSSSESLAPILRARTS